MFNAARLVITGLFLGIVPFAFSGYFSEATGKNLVANPSFEEGGSAVGKGYNEAGWTYFVIVEPVKREVTGGAKDGSQCLKIDASTKESNIGEGFLHSDPFNVAAGQKYNVSVWTKGKGDYSVQMLWWKEYSDMAAVQSERHRDVLKEGKASGSWKEVSAVVTSPPDAKRAYIRLVGKSDDVSFDLVSISK